MDWLKISIKDKIFTIQFGESEGLRSRADWDPRSRSAHLPARSQACRITPTKCCREGHGKERSEVSGNNLFGK